MQCYEYNTIESNKNQPYPINDIPSRRTSNHNGWVFFYAWYLSTIDQIGDLKNLHVVKIMQFWQNIKDSKEKLEMHVEGTLYPWIFLLEIRRDIMPTYMCKNPPTIRE